MNLSELIDAHRGGRTYADISRDCGGTPSAERVRQMLNTELRNFPDPPTVRALSKGLRVPEAEIVLAAAESLGLDVRRQRPRLVELLPDTASGLSEEQASAVAHLVRVFAGPTPEQRKRASRLLGAAHAVELREQLEDVRDGAMAAFEAGEITIADYDLIGGIIMGRLEVLREASEPNVLDVLAARRRAPEESVAAKVETPAAARPGIRRRSITDQAQNAAGEENQDHEGMDPS